MVDRVGDARPCFKRRSSSNPSSSLQQCCSSCHPDSCQSPCPRLSQGYWTPDFRLSRPLRPCLLSTSRTCPSSVRIPCRVPPSDGNFRPGRAVSPTRNASRKRHSHSAGNDAVVRRVQRISCRQARRRLRHGRLVSSARAWVDLSLRGDRRSVRIALTSAIVRLQKLCRGKPACGCRWCCADSSAARILRRRGCRCCRGRSAGV